ncbi:MAG: ACP S-malonyltransferase [Bacteroidales bacterium]|jgi:[acyl-carrier-protein] S-malonyltransferase|nr:ACP S-malonyltransferase [Bacteroidales bacterium]
MNVYIFPGQGAQFVGMGKDLYEQHAKAKDMFEKANEILGFRITDIMFDGSDEDLKQTKVTQPAVFLHSVIMAACTPNFKPDMVAGHSLGEFSALVANGCLSFEDGLRLVQKRANAMQKACELQPSTMAAIIGLEDEVVEEICKQISFGNGLQVTGDGCATEHTGQLSTVNCQLIVVAANYNSPAQLVISGSIKGVELACEKLKEAGAKRALPLKVGGAFHSPLMQPAAEELEAAINQTNFATPICPVYQNTDAKPHTNPDEIKKNLIAQLTAPVRWTQMVRAMLADGATEFTELGPGNVLMGLVGKIRGN